MPIDPEPLWLTFKLAAITSVLLLVIGVPLAAYLSSRRSFLKIVLEAVISLPLVLPPSVLGFYLLMMLSPNSLVGHFFLSTLNTRFIFSFPGLVLGSMLYSLPFMVQPVQAALESLPKTLHEASFTLGKSRWQTFVHVLLPNIKPALLSGFVLSFAHTLGEFGLVLMIGGNIAGQTRVASIAIYDDVESMNYASAHIYAGILLVVSFSILVFVYTLNRKWKLIGNR